MHPTLERTRWIGTQTAERRTMPGWHKSAKKKHPVFLLRTSRMKGLQLECFCWFYPSLRCSLGKSECQKVASRLRVHTPGNVFTGQDREVHRKAQLTAADAERGDGECPAGSKCFHYAQPGSHYISFPPSLYFKRKTSQLDALSRLLRNSKSIASAT